MLLSLLALKRSKANDRVNSLEPQDRPEASHIEANRMALEDFLASLRPPGLKFRPLIFPPDGRKYYDAGRNR